MNKVLTLLAFAIFVFSSCKKEEQPETQTPPPPAADYVYLNPSLNQLKFKAGTYWVYENDSTGILDSIAVDSARMGLFNPNIPHTVNNVYDCYRTYIHDFGNSRFYVEWLLVDRIYRNTSYTHPYPGKTMYDVNDTVGTFISPYAEITSEFSSINIFSNIFYNIRRMSFDSTDVTYPEFPNKTLVYYSDTIGIIKKEILLSPANIESWSLKRWNIIR